MEYNLLLLLIGFSNLNIYIQVFSESIVRTQQHERNVYLLDFVLLKLLSFVSSTYYDLRKNDLSSLKNMTLSFHASVVTPTENTFPDSRHQCHSQDKMCT